MTIESVREWFRQGASCALESGWACHDLLDEYALDNAELDGRTLLSSFITFLHNDLAAEGVARSTIADRINVTATWTRARVASLSIPLAYGHLRNLMGENEKETLSNTKKLLEWVRVNERLPVVEEVRDIINGREHEPLSEKAWRALVKAANRVIKWETNEMRREAAMLVIGRDNAEKDNW